MSVRAPVQPQQPVDNAAPVRPVAPPAAASVGRIPHERRPGPIGRRWGEFNEHNVPYMAGQPRPLDPRAPGQWMAGIEAVAAVYPEVLDAAVVQGPTGAPGLKVYLPQWDGRLVLQENPEPMDDESVEAAAETLARVAESTGLVGGGVLSFLMSSLTGMQARPVALLPRPRPARIAERIQSEVANERRLVALSRSGTEGSSLLPPEEPFELRGLMRSPTGELFAEMLPLREAQPADPSAPPPAQPAQQGYRIPLVLLPDALQELVSLMKGAPKSPLHA